MPDDRFTRSVHEVIAGAAAVVPGREDVTMPHRPTSSLRPWASRLEPGSPAAGVPLVVRIVLLSAILAAILWS